MQTEEKYKNKISKYVHKAKSMIGSPLLIQSKIDEAWEKGKNLDPHLRDLMENLEVFIDIIKDYFSGKYREVDQKTIVFLLAGILYFINPLDVIPDILPLIGFTDDAAVLVFILGRVKGEIEKYKLWKLNQKIEVYESES